MSSSAPEMQPDADEVLQVEEPYGNEPVVKVRNTGPVRTQSLPRKAGATGTKTVGTITSPGGAKCILRADHRRASAVLIADLPILIALSAASAQEVATMALWPGLVPYTLTATTELYVAAETGTASVSYIEELWAAGQDGGE